ncbi:NAD(P)-dependent oxidoreductase [Actinopolyspora mortivallis]|uniref:NAD(P)-dependent oxidoreductase n=1 Tax=Actinopolyspora mortivallis TaxID=33906 RepID=UPI00037CCE1A|nr:NAD(P)-dependent oxidoreductase [Actinopolyspora mortivallis]
MTTIAFLGTGTMGAPMARNLLEAGFDVRVWNRTAARAEPLGSAGATVAGTPEEAAGNADVLVSMLLDAEATVETGKAAVPELASEAIWVQMGTIGLSGMDRARKVAEGTPLVDAPVLGTRAPAEEGTLTVLAAAPRRIRTALRPIFDAVGRDTVWVGEDPARAEATRLKLAVNSWILSLTNAVGESMALAEHLGVDPTLFLGAIEGTATDSPYAHLKGSAILNGELAASFTVHGAGKDADLVLEAADHHLRMDLVAAARQRFARAEQAGYGNSDMAAAYYASFGPDGPHTSR